MVKLSITIFRLPLDTLFWIILIQQIGTLLDKHSIMPININHKRNWQISTTIF